MNWTWASNPLVGVVIGGLLTALGGFLGQWWVSKRTDEREARDRRAERNKEINAVATELLATALRTWNALTRWSAVITEEIEAKIRDLPGEVVDVVDNFREEDFAAVREASELMAWNRARLAILAPQLSEVAAALVSASNLISLEGGRGLETLENARKEAEAAFVTAVQQQINWDGPAHRHPTEIQA